MTISKRRLRPVELAIIIVPLCGLAFMSWRMWNRPKAVVPPHYTLTDLSAIGGFGGSGYATDLNDKGEITGVWSAKPVKGNFIPQVFVWKSGKFTLLKAWSWHPRINNNGVVIGSDRRNKPSRHFRWENGVLQSMATWTNDTEIRDINDLEQTLGVRSTSKSSISSPDRQAVVVQNGVLRELPIPSDQDEEDAGISTHPVKINNSGDVIANSATSAYLWSKGNTTLITNGDKETPAYAEDINNNGVTIGNTCNELASSQDLKAWNWSYENGRLSTLYKPSGIDMFLVRSLNDQGAIVGTAKSDKSVFAMLYLQGNLFNLQQLTINGSNWDLFNARKINNRGQIIVQGWHKRKLRYCLLTPIVR